MRTFAYFIVVELRYIYIVCIRIGSSYFVEVKSQFIQYNMHVDLLHFVCCGQTAVYPCK